MKVSSPIFPGHTPISGFAATPTGRISKMMFFHHLPGVMFWSIVPRPSLPSPKNASFWRFCSWRPRRFFLARSSTGAPPTTSYGGQNRSPRRGWRVSCSSRCSRAGSISIGPCRVLNVSTHSKTLVNSNTESFIFSSPNPNRFQASKSSSEFLMGF